MKTGNATVDGAALLDKVEGEGASERWVNMTLAGGGVVVCSPFLFFIAHDDEEEDGVIFVSYAYGDKRAVGEFALSLLHTGRWHYVAFRRNLEREGEGAQRKRHYDAERLVHLLNR